jgi:hypothetical protein
VKPMFADQRLDKGRPGSSKEVATLTACMTSHWAGPTLMCFSPLTVKNSAGPISTTLTGQVRGSPRPREGHQCGVHTFLGIPFAKPPVGLLQFAPPKPAAPWSGVRDGTSHPAM